MQHEAQINWKKDNTFVCVVGDLLDLTELNTCIENRLISGNSRFSALVPRLVPPHYINLLIIETNADQTFR